MTAAKQNELEIYRVIVFRHGGAEVLLVQNDGRFLLPSVSIPRWQRIAENVNAAMKSEWGEDVVCLLTLDSSCSSSHDQEIHYQVAEHWQSAGTPSGTTQWLDASAVSEDLFFDGADYRAIQYSLAKCIDDAADGQSNPFARLGWFRDLYQWVEAVIEQQGVHLNGSFGQLNASPSFSLIRFETDDPAFWFKAVGEPNQRELSITRTLSNLFPKYVPPILAERPLWNGWLTREVEGVRLDATQKCAHWEAAGSALAQLQVESVDRGDQILASGAHDLRTESLSGLIQPFMETMTSLMDQQTKVPPPILSRTELVLLAERVREALHVLEELGIPDTLGHLDLNPGNIIVTSDRCAFLDWTEACVGSPFFSIQYLLEHLRRAAGMNAAIESQLIESYCAPCLAILSYQTMATALEVSPLLAVFAYAAGSNAWRNPERSHHPATARYLRSLTRRMNVEATQLEQRRSACAQ